MVYRSSYRSRDGQGTPPGIRRDRHFGPRALRFSRLQPTVQRTHTERLKLL